VRLNISHVICNLLKSGTDRKAIIVCKILFQNYERGRILNKRTLRRSGIVLLALGFLLLVATALLLPTGPPVKVLYDQSGVVASYSGAYDKIVLQNEADEPVYGYVSVKTGLDYSPRESSSIQICADALASLLFQN